MSEIIVPEHEVGHLWLRWSGPPTTHLTIGPCVADADWVWFPGGYFVSEVGCYDIIVRSEDVDHQVSIGVGSPCPGQTPPIGFSET
jgi:hypothetical protein